ncbi:hypothetical protein [Exiguobacterium sp. s133]|uniref:hypothetical protein n=1 Tax=Exiguobacterium sp. s133 TaxID=2751213 RepID=UPI002037507D|nr:hypothetical protein [Exiguobacterium sp. s133]
MEDLKKLKKEDLTQRLDRHLDWIKSCDTKASIVIAGAGVFLSIFTAEHSISILNQILSKTLQNMNFSNFIYLAAFLYCWGRFTYGAYYLIRVLIPMMKNDLLLFKEGTREDSLYYFESSVDDKKYFEFKKKCLKKLRKKKLRTYYLKFT